MMSPTTNDGHWKAATMRVGGTRIYYREKGSGSPILLIHGTGHDADMWGGATEPLTADHLVIAYDRRGYSRSSGPPSGDYHLHAEDAAALIRELDVGSAVVVGWSNGGVIALDLAIHHPGLISHLILQEPALYATKDRGLDVARAFLPIILLNKMGMKRWAAERFGRWTYGSGGTGYDEFPPPWREATRRNAGTITTEFDGGTGEKVLTENMIRTIRHPVTGLLGELTQPSLRRCMERVAGLLPQTDVRVIQGGNHAMHLDNPKEWLTTVRQVTDASGDKTNEATPLEPLEGENK